MGSLGGPRGSAESLTARCGPPLDWKTGMAVPRDIAVAYLLQGSFYGHSIYATLYLDAWRKDSVVMLVHHVVTLVLIVSSYASGELQRETAGWRVLAREQWQEAGTGQRLILGVRHGSVRGEVSGERPRVDGVRCLCREAPPAPTPSVPL